MTPDEQSHSIIDLIQQMDETEQLIMLAGIRALAFRVFDIATYEAWIDDRMSRYRAGEELRLSDLDTALHPTPGCRK